MNNQRKELIRQLTSEHGKLTISDEAVPYFDCIPENMLPAAINGVIEWADQHDCYNIGEEEIIDVIDIRPASKKAICVANNGIKENAFLTYGDKNSETGIIFYPGGKVEYNAYCPLVKKISEKGYFTVLVEFPWNLAFYNNMIGDEVVSCYKNIKNWFIIGHSLGGAEGVNYLADTANTFKGIIFLGSYPKKPISIPSLSIYGTNDTVLNSANYKVGLTFHTEDFTEHVIEGGNHALFGDYGKQIGDTDATITRQEQQKLTVEYIDEFIRKEIK